jgi:hypothetical protein
MAAVTHVCYSGPSQSHSRKERLLATGKKALSMKFSYSPVRIE